MRAAAASGLLALWLLGVLGPVGAVAATPAYGTPSADAEWGTGISFRQLVTLDRDVIRAELLLSSPLDATGSFVVEVGSVGAGTTTLRYELDAADGALTPNTTYVGRWRLTYADGSRTLGPAVRATYRDTRFDWRTRTGSTVRIHWYEGDARFGERALAIAERAIASSSALLGVTETRMVDFFVYADESAFYDALGPGTRENVGGQAVPELRTLFALITPDSIDASWVATVIPHELSHLVFDTAVRNDYHYPPSWLNEGLAVYLAQGYDRGDRRLVRAAVADGTLMPLEALTGQFPTTYEMFSLAYAESASAVDFAVREYGRPALVTLIRSYRSGVSDDDALRSAFGVDLAGFQAAWLDDLGAAAPARHGPVPPVPGDVPDAWAGPAPTAETWVEGAPVTSPAATPGADDGVTPGGMDPTIEGLAIGSLVGVAIAAIVVLVLRGGRRDDAGEAPER